MSAAAKLWVGNLAPGIPDRDVEEAFSKYGILRNCWVARKPPGFGFVEFEDRRDAEDAVRGLDGKNGWRVEFARAAGPKTGGGGGGYGGDRYGGGGGGYGGGGYVGGRGRSPSPRRRSPSPPRRRSPSYDGRRSRSPPRRRSRSRSRAARMPSEAPLRGARKLLQSGAYVCVRPLNILPGDFLDTAALVHCYLQQGSGTAPAWSIAYSKEGTHAEFDTDHSKRQCHAVQGASLKAVQDASYFQIRHGPWGVADYEILDNNCCHFVDQILLDAGSSGVESYFPS